MNETEEALSSCIEELLKRNDAIHYSTTEQQNSLTNDKNETVENYSKIVVNKSNEVNITNVEDPLEVKDSSYCVSTSTKPRIVTEDETIDKSMSPPSRIEISDADGSFLHEDTGVERISKSADETPLRRPTSSQAHESTKSAGWIFQGEHNGYVYYTDNSGQVYSVDRNGYWYIQEDSGDFIPYDSSLHYGSIQLQMFPMNDDGQPILPSNAQGEKIFPTDANHMPIFPLDPKTNQPTFPVDDIGQPVFPSGVNGRAIVPVDSNGAAIFPRGENGRFIFPSGTNGNPVAPVNIYGVPVLPLDSNGKPVIPYDSNGAPLIHLANDGVTPLTEEEYQYSLQWSDYYDKYNQYYNQQNASNQGSSGVITATSAETLEQHEKNLKLLKKVRPEDIDLPPSEPPPVTGPVPVSMTPVSAIPRQEQPKNDEKSEAEMQLKAKTKRLLEMQLRFTRKAAFGGGRTNSSKTTKGNDSTSDTGDGSPEAGAAASAKNDSGLQIVRSASNVGDTDAGIEMVEALQAGAIADESVAKEGLTKPVPVQKLQDRASSTESSLNRHQLGRDGGDDLISSESSKTKQVLESSRDELAATRDVAMRGERDATKSMENDSVGASRKDSAVEAIVRNQDSSQKIADGADSEIMRSPIGNVDSTRGVDSSFSKRRSRKDDSNRENERRYSRSSSEERPRNVRRSSSRRRRSSSRNNRDSIDRERLYSERSYRASRWRNSRSRSDSYSPRYRSRSPSRRRLSSFRRSRSSPRYSSRSPDRSRDRYSRRERSSSRTRRYIRERSTQRRGRSYTSNSHNSFYSSRSSRCWSSSRERSPYRGRLSYHSHWERSSSRRRSRSPAYLSPRRGDDNGRSYSRDRWSRRRSRNCSLHRCSRSTSRSHGRAASRTSCSPRSVNDSAKGTAVRSVTSTDSRYNDSAKVKNNESHSASPIPLPSDLTSVRSDVSSKLKSSTKTITSYSEKSLTERSESDGQMAKAKTSKKKKKKKKKDRKGSSSRKNKENNAKGERATEATSAKESDSHLDASETEPLEFVSYGPLPPKKMLNDVESDPNEVADWAKDAKSAKDKETKVKKKKKRKKRSKGSNSEHEEDIQENRHHEPEVDEAEVDGIEPGEIREQDPSPKHYVDESDGLSVVFIGPKWEGSTKNSDTAKSTDDGIHIANDAPPKMFYTKFIRETISSPIVTFTSNPTMAESFMKLKREFDAADGPRRSVQASKHFQAAMEILNESSTEQCDPTDETAKGLLTSKHLTSKAIESNKNDSTTDNKWKSLEETAKERREKKKAKKEKKLKRALEREKKMNTGEDLTTSLTEERDAETTAHVEGSDVKAAHCEQVSKELPGNANEVMTKEFEIATEKKMTKMPLSRSEIAPMNESEISARRNKAATEDIIEGVSESLQPSIMHAGSVVETDTTVSTELGTCDTQPSTGAGSIDESLSATSLRFTKIPQQLDSQREPYVTDVAVASISGKGEKGTQADDETRRRKEIMKRKLEEEEEDELSRLRYEALRSKTRRLMNDLRMERRRLKRERLRATLAMRRIRGYEDDISVDDLLMANSSETSDTDDSNASNRANMKSTKRRLIKRARTSGDGSWRYNRYKSLNIHDDERNDSRMQTMEESMPTTNTVITSKSPPISDNSSQNDLISELQNRIGGTNKGALQLLEQLRRSLAASRGANIHLNPDMILNSP